MTDTVTILGAKGRFGRAAMHAFAQAGWRVSALARRWEANAPTGAQRLTGDAIQAETLIDACKGSDVIVNALNPPYPDWSRVLPVLTKNVIAAAKRSGATVMIPGNVYNFGPLRPGEPMPAVITEDLPQRPCSKKGKLRVVMEQSYRDAAEDGLQTILLRGGDFIEATKSGNWFDSQMTTGLHKGRFTYPGPLDQMHAWAYLPDMARAMAGLAAKRHDLPAYFPVGFAGYSLTGAQMTSALERVTGRPLIVNKAPWGVIRAGALVSPLLREILEMRYLWDQEHRLGGERLATVLPSYQDTPLEQALAEATGVMRLAA